MTPMLPDLPDDPTPPPTEEMPATVPTELPEMAADAEGNADEPRVFYSRVNAIGPIVGDAVEVYQTILNNYFAGELAHQVEVTCYNGITLTIQVRDAVLPEVSIRRVPWAPRFAHLNKAEFHPRKPPVRAWHDLTVIQGGPDEVYRPPLPSGELDDSTYTEVRIRTGTSSAEYAHDEDTYFFHQQLRDWLASESLNSAIVMRRSDGYVDDSVPPLRRQKAQGPAVDVDYEALYIPMHIMPPGGGGGV